MGLGCWAWIRSDLAWACIHRRAWAARLVLRLGASLVLHRSSEQLLAEKEREEKRKEEKDKEGKGREKKRERGKNLSARDFQVEIPII